MDRFLVKYPNCRAFRVKLIVERKLSLAPWNKTMEATVYILRCIDGSYYTGLTKRPIGGRVDQHNTGEVEGYTHSRLPVELVFTETYERILDAIARERQIKRWTRCKKEALIRYDYESLPKLARRKKR